MTGVIDVLLIGMAGLTMVLLAHELVLWWLESRLGK